MKKDALAKLSPEARAEIREAVLADFDGYVVEATVAGVGAPEGDAPPEVGLFLTTKKELSDAAAHSFEFALSPQRASELGEQLQHLGKLLSRYSQ